MTFALVVPGPLDRRSGGYSYDVDLVAHLRSQGHETAVWSLPERGADRELERFLKDEPEVVIFDALVQHGLAGGWPRLARSKRGLWVGLIHLLAWHAAGSKAEAERLRRQERDFLEPMDAFLFNSEDSRQGVRALLGPGARFRPSVVCRPPLGSLPEEVFRPTGQGRLLFLANVLPRKNLEGLLRALALLQARRPDLRWELTIAGAESDPRYARACRAAARGLAVRWAGWVADDERQKLWREMDLLVLPSFHEGWGMAHAEALVRGIPSLAVPRGASLEVLGDAALWSEPEAVPMAAALERYLTDEVLRQDLARRARHRAAVLTAITGFDALPAFWSDLARRPPAEEFLFASYLEAKSAVDSRALHPRIWESAFEGDRPRSVIDLGGGTGTMARRLRERGYLDERTDYLLVDRGRAEVVQAQRLTEPLFAPGRFRALEQDLLAFWEETRPPADLVIAHAVLDLFDPLSAAPALARMNARRYWLTHLFDGFTAWEPVIDPVLDEALAAAYHRTMDERAPGGARGAARSGRDWLNVLPSAGFRVIGTASSDWLVRPSNGAYTAEEPVFLQSILHFFRSSLTGRPDVDQDGLAWWLAVRHGQIERAEATFIAHQYDVVAELK